MVKEHWIGLGMLVGALLTVVGMALVHLGLGIALTGAWIFAAAWVTP